MIALCPAPSRRRRLVGWPDVLTAEISAEIAGGFTPESASEPGEPRISGFDEPAPVARPAPARPAAGTDRRGLFTGEYSERERDLRRSGGGPDPQDRSLEAVFSRLSGAGGERLPDPRDRARTNPGLGPVFGRLR